MATKTKKRPGKPKAVKKAPRKPAKKAKPSRAAKRSSRASVRRTARPKKTAKKTAMRRKAARPAKKRAVRRATPARRRAAPRRKARPMPPVEPGEERKEDYSVFPPPSDRGLGPEAGGQAGDIEGLSRVEEAAPESVEELVEEGQAFEAGVVSGVENAPDADVAEVITREVPEDDVPEEYRDER
jgi:hypothetical protein